jgi:serine/threonine protein kinase
MVRPTRLSSRLRRAPTRYRPVSRIAAGGMAEVWRAEALFETGDRHMVAIKRVLPELAADPLYRSMFEDEARLGMKLRHANVVRVYDARDIAGTYLMIMELVDGTSLKALLDKAHRREACMPVPTALFMLRELARALDYAHVAQDATGAHLGIIHRDVSPHNVLLGRKGVVKLADFGLANAAVHQTMRSKDLVGGKIGYLAPEVIMQKPADHRIDIFAAGIVLWEALAGRRLFEGKDDPETVRNVVRKEVPPPSIYNSAIPPEVDDLVARALDRNPDRRIPSARVLIEMAEACIATVDAEVGPKDVGLLVGLHLAGVRQPKLEATGLDILARELEAFVDEAAAVEFDMGAQPLDPASFSIGSSSGVRPLPSEDHDEDAEDDWYETEP